MINYYVKHASGESFHFQSEKDIPTLVNEASLKNAGFVVLKGQDGATNLVIGIDYLRSSIIRPSDATKEQGHDLLALL